MTKEFKLSVPKIPWDYIPSIRNRVCHDYDVVDDNTLYQTVKIDFPLMEEELLNHIPVFSLELDSRFFERIKTKNKTIEARVNNPEIRKIKTSNLIIFSDKNTSEKLIAEVIGKEEYKTFYELYVHYKKSELGYSKEEESSPDDMLSLYSMDEMKKYGVVAIQIQLY